MPGVQTSTLKPGSVPDAASLPMRALPQESRVSVMAKSVFWTFAMLFDPVTDFFTQGVADFLALETLRHGTSYENYLSIRIHGADPNYGGKGNGSIAGTDNSEADSGWNKRAQGYFFAFKDSEALEPDVGEQGSQIAVRILPRLFCVLSAVGSVQGEGTWTMAWRVTKAVLNFFYVPTLKFHFIPEEISGRFENDHDFAPAIDKEEAERTHIPTTRGLAYKTKEAIGTEHIGLQGVLTQGLKGNLAERMQAHPGKVAWGLAKLINPIGLVILAGLGIALAVKQLKNLGHLSEHIQNLPASSLKSSELALA